LLRREDYVYVGVDLHKAANVAMMVDCFGDPVGKSSMKFENTRAAFSPWVEQVKRRAKGKAVVFGLEDVHGLGLALATFLLEAGETVKYVNAYSTKQERKEVNKTDKIDALAVARVTQRHVHDLPDATVDPLWLALVNTVSHRRGLVEEQIRIKNRLHNLLMRSWPGWGTFFSEPFDSKAALAFWVQYPSVYRVQGVDVEDLTKFLQEASHWAMGRKHAERIVVAASGCPVQPPYQEEQDYMIRSSIAQLRFLREQLTEVRSRLAGLIAQTGYDLTQIPGVDVVLSAQLISLIGDVTRFPNPDKFVSFCGIAPVTFASGEKDNRKRSKFGRRELHSLIHQLSIYQLVVHAKTKTPRNPEAKAYYDKHLGDQAARPSRERDRKTVKKALVSLMRQQAIRLYKLMKAQKVAELEQQKKVAAKPATTPEAA